MSGTLNTSDGSLFYSYLHHRLMRLEIGPMQCLLHAAGPNLHYWHLVLPFTPVLTACKEGVKYNHWELVAFCTHVAHVNTDTRCTVVGNRALDLPSATWQSAPNLNW
ncbi:neurogenic differentiation factor 4 [Platysternon megacephalum]|uniref:Neurogenic differentiation factor 4 n=1 Tax=Platysternon megacephalum TaxID=55544 RepID=A0A4D9E2E2_9SAUR|nr:neurogenic differentiation factor 4 [Platysternon megacephalum]